MVINLHITSYCNYQCKFCFAGFEGTKQLSLNEWKQVVDVIDHDTKHLAYRRINLAGGEPTLMPGFAQLCQYIHSKGITVSFITNGFWLSKNMCNQEIRNFLQNYIDMVGLSIDSLEEETNHALGRHTRNLHVLSRNDYHTIITQLHELGVRVKVNTVVTTTNEHESLESLLDSGAINRFKILRMSAIDGENNKAWSLLPSDASFEAFVHRHKRYQPVVEGKEAMKGSYIFVNPQGQLVDNSQGSHQYGLSLLSHSFDEAFSQINFNQTKYDERYRN